MDTAAVCMHIAVGVHQTNGGDPVCGDGDVAGRETAHCHGDILFGTHRRCGRTQEPYGAADDQDDDHEEGDEARAKGGLPSGSASAAGPVLVTTGGGLGLG
ncbi:MAG: hypothetical protein OHK0015_15300 [Chloroflexi bacterium OHK40]